MIFVCKMFIPYQNCSNLLYVSETASTPSFQFKKIAKHFEIYIIRKKETVTYVSYSVKNGRVVPFAFNEEIFQKENYHQWEDVVPRVHPRTKNRCVAPFSYILNQIILAHFVVLYSGHEYNIDFPR